VSLWDVLVKKWPQVAGQSIILKCGFGNKLQIRFVMKFLIDNWALFLVALGSGAMLLWPAIKGGGLASGGSLNANAAVLLMNREKAVVVDVSEAADYAAGHIVGSKNLPSGELEAKLADAVKNKGLPLILVCPTGSRASRLVATAKKLGYANAQAGAMLACHWKKPENRCTQLKEPSCRS
jgi:rhodanese-related sulfurtransferase